LPKALSLEDIIRIYVQLEENYLKLPPLIADARPRDIDRLSEFLAGYSQQIYEIHEIDFYDITGLDELLQSIVPEQRDVYSFCQIFGRKSAKKNSSEPVERLVRIFINDHPADNATKLVNDCWKRFCQIKEICQAILYEHLNSEDPALYPETAEYTEIVKLFSDINNKPFSMSDFGNPQYPQTLAVENAAELLAAMLMVPIDELQSYRQEIMTELGETGLRSYNYFDIALHYKTPRRYIEVLITWDFLDDFVSMLNVGRA
jgi:hypothetical protein